ncbi:MAG TPA: PH domain-containing protein [Gaiellaceae bacterium]|nr:PH domain-containing protein [Gaiellaceae bacterium]
MGRSSPSPVLEARRHGIVLVRPFLRALGLAGVGGATFLLPWPAAVAGAVLLAAAALTAVVGVARWDRAHVVLTPDSLQVVGGVLHRHSATVALEPGGAVEVEQTLAGRVLGYATVVAGELEVAAVPRRLANALRQPH